MALEALPAAIGEATAFLLGKVLRRVYKLEPKRAERLGEWIVLGIITVAGLAVTLIYS